MRNLLFLVIAISQTAAAGDADTDIHSWTYEEASILLQKAYLDPNHSDYTRKTIGFNQEHKITEESRCYMFDGEVSLITVTDIHGVIQRAIPNVQTEKSKCFVELLEGQQFPAPPYAPFFDEWIFI